MKRLFKIVINGHVYFTENAHIANRGDRAWCVAWEIAEKQGCIAPDTIEVLDIKNDDPIVIVEDREDCLKSECQCIIFTNTFCDIFPDFDNNIKDKGFIFIYNCDQFSFSEAYEYHVKASYEAGSFDFMQWYAADENN